MYKEAVPLDQSFHNTHTLPQGGGSGAHRMGERTRPSNQQMAEVRCALCEARPDLFSSGNRKGIRSQGRR